MELVGASASTLSGSRLVRHASRSGRGRALARGVIRAVARPSSDPVALSDELGARTAAHVAMTVALMAALPANAWAADSTTAAQKEALSEAASTLQYRLDTGAAGVREGLETAADYISLLGHSVNSAASSLSEV